MKIAEGSAEPAQPAETPSLWRGRGLFTAWGPEQHIDQAAKAGFDWLALQCTNDATHLALIGEEADRVRAAGMAPVGWGVPPFVCPANVAGVIVQVETADQYRDALPMGHTLAAAATPRACVTTFGGSDTPELVKPLADLYSLALVECYVQDDPIHGDINRMLWQAHQDGWPAAVPVIGLYRDVTVDAYTHLDMNASFAVWLAEEMSDADWAAMAATR